MADNDDETGVDDAAKPDGHLCPECGEEFERPQLLGLHRKLKHGVRSKREEMGKTDRKPGKGRPSRESRQQRRRENVRQTLTELVSFRDELAGQQGSVIPETLAELIRRDADRIADALAWTAERFSPLGKGIDWLCGHGGPVTIFRGFAGMAGFALRGLRRRREEAAQYVDIDANVPEETRVTGDGWRDTPAA